MDVQELHDKYGAPLQCPSCGYDLIIDSVDLRCPNPDCRAQKIYRVEHFIKKLGVMNASYKTLDNLGIDSYEKLLAFRPAPGKAIEKKLSDELVAKVFVRSPEDIFAALNIRDLGEKLQKKVIEYYGWKNVSDPEFGFHGNLPPGIGEITLAKFKEARPENLRVMNMFVKDIRYSWTESPAVPRRQTAAKGSVCFTGALSIPRSQAAKLAEAAGFEVKNAVTKGLTYLVTPDPNSGSSKNEKAKKYGTKVIDEAAFMELVKINDDSIMDM